MVTHLKIRGKLGEKVREIHLKKIELSGGGGGGEIVIQNVWENVDTVHLLPCFVMRDMSPFLVTLNEWVWL